MTPAARAALAEAATVLALLLLIEYGPELTAAARHGWARWGAPAATARAASESELEVSDFRAGLAGPIPFDLLKAENWGW